MKNDILLQLYKEEKALIADPMYFGFDFPTFKEWKREYMIEHHKTHRTVNVTQADEEAELTIKQASSLPIPKPLNEDSNMSENTTATSTVKPTNDSTTATTTVKPESKRERAQVIFDANFGTLQRKDIIAKFVNEVELTAAGASTYYQQMKKKAETPTS